MDPDGVPMLSDSPDGEKPAQVNGREHLLGHEETRENADAVPDEDSASGRRGPSSGLRAASQSSEMRTGKGPSDWATRESSVASRQRTRGDAEERDCLVAWRPRAGGRAWDPGLRRREAASDRSLSGWEAERKHAGCQRGMRAQTATSSNGFRVSEQREAGYWLGEKWGPTSRASRFPRRLTQRLPRGGHYARTTTTRSSAQRLGIFWLSGKRTITYRPSFVLFT